MTKRKQQYKTPSFLKLTLFAVGLFLVAVLLGRAKPFSQFSKPITINQIGHENAIPITEHQKTPSATHSPIPQLVVHNYAPHGVLADDHPAIAHNDGTISADLHHGPASCPDGQVLVYHSGDTKRSCVSPTDHTCGNVGFYQDGRCNWPGEHVGPDAKEVCDWNVPHNQTGHNFPFLSSNCPASHDLNQEQVHTNRQTCQGEGWWNPANEHCYKPGDQLPASELIVCQDSDHATPHLALPRECTTHDSHAQPEIVLPPAQLIPHACPEHGWTFNNTTKQCEAPQSRCQPGVSADGHTKSDCHEDGRLVLSMCPDGKFNDGGDCITTPDPTPHITTPVVDNSHDTVTPFTAKPEFIEEELQALEEDPSLWEEIMLWIEEYFAQF